MRVPCRCKKCDRRKALNLRPEDYYRVPKCPRCGSQDWRVDEYRYRLGPSEKRDTCNCGYIPFPHRKASMIFCVHHPEEPDEDDIRAMGRTLAASFR